MRRAEMLGPPASANGAGALPRIVLGSHKSSPVERGGAKLIWDDSNPADDYKSRPSNRRRPQRDIIGDKGSRNQSSGLCRAFLRNKTDKRRLGGTNSSLKPTRHTHGKELTTEDVFQPWHRLSCSTKGATFYIILHTRCPIALPLFHKQSCLTRSKDEVEVSG